MPGRRRRRGASPSGYASAPVDSGGGGVPTDGGFDAQDVLSMGSPGGTISGAGGGINIINTAIANAYSASEGGPGGITQCRQCGGGGGGGGCMMMCGGGCMMKCGH